MRNHLFAFASSASLAALLASCVTTPVLRPVVVADASGDHLVTTEARTAESGKASLSLTVRWPTRTSQSLPPSAVRVEAAVRDKSGNPLGAASVTRDGAPTSTLAITDIEVPVDGLVTITVRAIDAGNEEVGVGSKSILLVPNQRTAAAITVTATKVPGLTLLNPLAAGPGTVVKASGINLPKAKDGVSLSLGGVPVEILNVDISGGTYLEFLVPASATSDQVLLSYLGQTAKSNDVFQTVKAITLEVPASGIASGSKANFVAKALNSASEPVSGARLTWNLINVTGVPGSSSGSGGAGGGAAGVPGSSPGGGGAGSMDSNYVGSFVEFLSTTTISGGGAAAGGGAPGSGDGSSGGSVSPPQATNSITFTTAGTATVEVKTGQTVATATIVIGP